MSGVCHGNCRKVYEDKPLDYENWDIDIYYRQKHDLLMLNGAPQLVENGSLQAVIRFFYRYRNSTFVQDMVLYRNNRRIDFVTRADRWDTLWRPFEIKTFRLLS